MNYFNVVIDNKSDQTDQPYTYGYEGDEIITPGSKVTVPFARSKGRTGYVISEVPDPAQIDEKVRSKIRSIESVDEDVSLTEEMIRTAIWMRGRYVCRFIDAINCFTPAGAKAKRGKRKDPFAGEEGQPPVEGELTAEQQKALDSITAPMKRHETGRFLLHGVTGSGKTEVYIRAAKEAIALGRTVIILVPEISLTGQIIERFVGHFGMDNVAVLHSRLTLGERYDQWQRIRSGRVKVVIGARSAVFAPLENIGLIVVDEEHESTYKSDYTPKYDTVEVALKRLQDLDNKGVLVLGSATPSIVTYSRGQEGIYEILTMQKRYNEVALPQVIVADMREELKAGNLSIISRALYGEMKKQLEEGKQVMLFLNRRGYSTFISCRECGYVAKCPECGLSMTFHKNTGKLVCHYCGREETPPKTCPECGSKYVKFFGTGTEKVEETITELFPDYPMDRVDLDSVKKRGELQKKLKAFERGKTRILVGTQLIAKGLDFRNVGLVGIVSADVSLNIPDFRSPERAFQLITQAAGRAGRGDEAGKVVIQTYSPENDAIQFAARQDYKGFYESEMQFRKYMNYPPLSDIFQIIFTAGSEEAAKAGAQRWHDRLSELMTKEEQAGLFSPQPAYMNKIKDTYRYSLVIKCPKGDRRKYTSYIRQIKTEDTARKTDYNAVVDVNPYSFA